MKKMSHFSFAWIRFTNHSHTTVRTALTIHTTIHIVKGTIVTMRTQIGVRVFMVGELFSQLSKHQFIQNAY